MATVIDSLIVTLGLDSKDFKKGSKDAEADFKRTKTTAAKTGKDIEQAGKQGAEFFNQLSKSAIKFFSVLTVGRGIGDFVSNVINGGAQLDRMSTRVNESAANLSRWQGAVKQSGGTAEGFLATVQGISNQMTQLQLTGDAPMVMLLQKLGVSAVEADGKAKPILKLIRDIGDSLDDKQWANADKFNQLLAAGFDEGTINLLMRGRQEREKMLASQREYSDADAKAAREASERWELAKQRIEKLTQTLVFKLLPAFEKVLDVIGQLGDATVPLLSKSIEGWGMIFDITKNWVETLLKAVNVLEKITGIDIGGKIKKGLSNVPLFKAASLFGDDSEAPGANAKSSAPASRMASGKLSGESAPVSYDMANKLAAADKAAGLPPGTMASIMKQEVGDGKAYLDDPSKYHYEKDAEGKRKSSAFGPFGILESTGKKPGYGVDPLKDKSLDEQIRFASQYAAARIKASGSVAGGLAGYGEGSKYADQVTSRLPGGVMSGLPAAGAGRQNSQGQSISIGEVKVYTQATDADGIARDMNSAIVRQADAGMR